jgi:hypothetical protein
MDDARQLMIESGWSLARKNGHEIWRCPASCGQHQIVISATPSDWRAAKNAVAQVWRTGCSSLPLEEAVDTALRRADDLEDFRTYECHFCGRILAREEYRHTWVKHSNISACLGHRGVPQWHGEERAKERLTQKAARKR